MIHYNKRRIRAVFGMMVVGLFAVTWADPEVDLKGKVISGSSGVVGARVALLAQGASDTTDAVGSFRIVVNPASIWRPRDGIASTSSEDHGIGFYDAAGRLQITGRETGVHSSHRFHLGESWRAVSEVPLAKAAAVVDTLLITRSGYRARKISVPNLLMDLDTIQLQMETDRFEIRKPVERTFQCETSSVQELDLDLVCESNNDSLVASVYVQSRPVSCGAMSAINYTAEKAWIKTAEGIQALSPVTYDGGGNHRNDRVTFSWNGKFYSFYHSSFGFGWRACATPDCMQICKDQECRTVLYDGCNRAKCDSPPALKVSCAMVKPDGTVPDRLDPWTKQAGNANYPLLPCGGDPVCR